MSSDKPSPPSLSGSRCLDLHPCPPLSLSPHSGCDFDSWQTTTSPVARAIPGKSFVFLDAHVLLWESFRQEHAWEDLLFRISRFWLIPWERSRKLVQVQ